MSDNASIEQALKTALDTLAKTDFKPAAQAFSTDPVPPDHHLELIGNAANIVDYVTTEVAKHKQLLNILETFNSKISDSHSILSNKVVAGIIETEKKKWYQLSTAHKIEVVIVVVLVVAAVSIFKFLL